MNTFKFNDINFTNSQSYKNFINNNSSKGTLNIRAYAANEAIPMSDVKVIVSKVIDNNKIIFFEGKTNNSGIINKIELPAPKPLESNLETPNSTEYDIEAIYDSTDLVYRVKIYANIIVLQSINIVPDVRIVGGMYGN